MIRPKAILHKQIMNPFPDRLIQIRLPFLIRQDPIRLLNKIQILLLLLIPINLLQCLRTTRTWEEILALRHNRIPIPIPLLLTRLAHQRRIRPHLILQRQLQLPNHLLHPATAPVSASTCDRSRAITNRDMIL